MKRLDTRKLTSTAIFLSLALMLSIIENMLPPIVPFLPQAKIGIANIVILTSILLLGKWQALVIVMMRALINAIFSGNPVAFIYSFTAGVISYGVMVGLVRTRVLSLVAISCLSAMVHNFVQVCVAAAMTETSAVFVYLPYLAVIGGTAGALIGLACHYIIKKYPLNTLSDSFKGGGNGTANAEGAGSAKPCDSNATCEVDTVSDAAAEDANQSNSIDSDNGAEPCAVEKNGSNASDVDTATSTIVDCTTEGNSSDNSCDIIAGDVANVTLCNSEVDTATSENGAESCNNGEIDNAK